MSSGSRPIATCRNRCGLPHGERSPPPIHASNLEPASPGDAKGLRALAFRFLAGGRATPIRAHLREPVHVDCGPFPFLLARELFQEIQGPGQVRLDCLACGLVVQPPDLRQLLVRRQHHEHRFRLRLARKRSNGRGLSTSPDSSQARRATTTPHRSAARPRRECASLEITSRTPPSCASFAWTSLRSRRWAWALISSATPFRAARSITAPRSNAYGSRFRTPRP